MTTREFAIIIWISFFFILFYIRKSIESTTIKAVIESAFNVVKSPISLFVLSYNLIVLYLIYFYANKNNIYLSKWYIKDYMLIVFFVVYPLVITSKNNKITEMVRSKFKEYLIISSLLTFITDTYTFSLFFELIIIFTIGFVMLIISVSDLDEKHKRVSKLSNAILNIFILGLIVFSIKNFICNISDVKKLDFWFSFALELLVILINIPMLYIAQKMIFIERLIGFSDFSNNFLTYIRYYFKKLYKSLKYRFLIGEKEYLAIVTVDKAFYGYPKITIKLKESIEISNSDILDLIARAYVNCKRYFKVSEEIMINYPIYIEIVNQQNSTIALWQEEFFSKSWLLYDPFSSRAIKEIYPNVFREV